MAIIIIIIPNASRKERKRLSQGPDPDAAAAALPLPRSRVPGPSKGVEPRAAYIIYIYIWHSSNGLAVYGGLQRSDRTWQCKISRPGVGRMRTAALRPRPPGSTPLGYVAWIKVSMDILGERGPMPSCNQPV